MKLFDKISNSLFFEERLQTMAGEIDENVQRVLDKPYETFVNEEYDVVRHRYGPFWRLLVRVANRSAPKSRNELDIIKNDLVGVKNETFEFPGVVDLQYSDAIIWAPVEPPTSSSPTPFKQLCEQLFDPANSMNAEIAWLRDILTSELRG